MTDYTLVSDKYFTCLYDVIRWRWQGLTSGNRAVNTDWCEEACMIAAVKAVEGVVVVPLSLREQQHHLCLHVQVECSVLLLVAVTQHVMMLSY